MKKENQQVKDKKYINVLLSVEKKGVYNNLYIETPNGVRVQVKLAFNNPKLLYKLVCEIEGK